MNPYYPTFSGKTSDKPFYITHITSSTHGNSMALTLVKVWLLSSTAIIPIGYNKYFVFDKILQSQYLRFFDFREISDRLLKKLNWDQRNVSDIGELSDNAWSYDACYFIVQQNTV